MKKKSWQEGLAASITDAGELCRALKLPEQYEKYERIISQFPVRITPYYLSLIDLNDPHDPIARMSIPSDEELDVSGTGFAGVRDSGQEPDGPASRCE